MESNKTAIIVVDPIKSFDDDARDKKSIQELKEINSFSYFIKYAIDLEAIKENVDVHILKYNGGQIMKKFESKKYHQLSDIAKIDENYYKYLFCGFHLNDCIKGAIKELTDKRSIDFKKIGIILNLMMITPEINLNRASKNFFHPYGIDLYYWTRLGHKKITIIN